MVNDRPKPGESWIEFFRKKRNKNPEKFLILSVYLKGNKTKVAMNTTTAAIAIPIQ